ncbi:MAG: glycosyltransferase family protein [Luteolibacter sp.]
MQASAKPSPRILVIHKGYRAHTWAEDLVAGFEKIGSNVKAVSMRDRSPEEIAEKRKNGLKLFSNPLTVARCKETIATFQPDLIVLMNFTGLPPEANAALREAAKPGTPIIAWLADHVSAFPEGARPNLDHIYAFDSATIEVLSGYYTSLSHLPLAAAPERYTDFSQPWEDRKPGLVFIGKNSASRRETITDLRSQGLPVAAFGPGAQCGFRFWRKRRVSPLTAAKTYGSYQAVLNLLQPPNTIHGLNLRAFEVPLSGALATYPLTPDVSKSFAIGEEIIAFKDLSDLRGQLESLAKDPLRAEAIIAAARHRVLADHTYEVRARKILTDWLP